MKDRLSSYCKQCIKIKYSTYYKHNKTKETKRKRTHFHKNKETERARPRKYLYGIDQNEFDQLFKKQNFSCAICKTTEIGKLWWCVDHDHESNCVRGILCHSCNCGLGMFKDRAENLRVAADYLDYFNSK
jgi:hypothetical protein